jgi:hypothetical protein
LKSPNATSDFAVNLDPEFLQRTSSAKSKDQVQFPMVLSLGDKARSNASRKMEIQEVEAQNKYSRQDGHGEPVVK